MENNFKNILESIKDIQPLNKSINGEKVKSPTLNLWNTEKVSFLFQELLKNKSVGILTLDLKDFLINSNSNTTNSVLNPAYDLKLLLENESDNYNLIGFIKGKKSATIKSNGNKLKFNSKLKVNFSNVFNTE